MGGMGWRLRFLIAASVYSLSAPFSFYGCLFNSESCSMYEMLYAVKPRLVFFVKKIVVYSPG